MRTKKESAQNREARQAAIVAACRFRQTLKLEDLEAFRVAAEYWRETAADENDEEEWNNAKKYTRLAYQFTNYAARKATTTN